VPVAAARLAVDPETVRRWIRHDFLGSVRINNKMYVRPEDLTQLQPSSA
jgi:hypothetical protein